MKNVSFLYTILICLVGHGVLRAQRVDVTLPMSCRMIESEMVRFPNTWMLDFRQTPKWGYTNGLECHAMLEVARFYPQHRDRFLTYARGFADAHVQEDGSISRYSVDEYNIDHIAPGPMLLDLYDMTRQQKYLVAARLLRSQIDTHPRTADGSFWHKKVYPNQVWLDGLYMGQPFYAEWAQRFDQPELMADVIKQITLVAQGTYDPATGLYKHAFDFSRTAFWADTQNGQSKHVWGRAMGWYAMAIVEALDFIPANEPTRNEVIVILNHLVQMLDKYRDSSTGLFYQVMDLPERDGNYIEGTCSSMFAYSLLKASRLGYIAKTYDKLGREVYASIVKNLIKIDSDGVVSLTRCCAVAGLGPESNKRRDGSFEYYISEPIRDNDPKGVGPFILASLEMERRNRKQ